MITNNSCNQGISKCLPPLVCKQYTQQHWPCSTRAAPSLFQPHGRETATPLTFKRQLLVTIFRFPHPSNNNRLRAAVPTAASIGRGRHSNNWPRREKRPWPPKCENTQPMSNRSNQAAYKFPRLNKAFNTVIHYAESRSASFLGCTTFAPLVLNQNYCIRKPESGLDTCCTTTK